MTNIPGTKIVIGDADALIALLSDEDTNYNLSTKISQRLLKEKIEVIFPSTAIAEAITSLRRKHSNPKVAGYLNMLYQKGKLKVEYIDEETMRVASTLFNPKGSKQNTFFDCLVAACAKKLDADVIFSFDSWYKRLGFKLAADL